MASVNSYCYEPPNPAEDRWVHPRKDVLVWCMRTGKQKEDS